MIRLALALCLLAGGALAHDGPGDWIGRGGWQNPVTNEVCCTPTQDCHPVPAVDVLPGAAGWFITTTGERIPYRETLPSQDGRFWRCQRPNGTRRCFFAPPTTS